MSSVKPEAEAAKLQAISEANPLAHVVLKALISYRIRESMDLRRFKQKLLVDGINASQQEINKVFKAMERAGFGKLVLNESPTPPRFYWAKGYGYLEIAQVLEAWDEECGEKPAGAQTAQGRRHAVLEQARPGGRALTFPWGAGLESLELSGVTRAEVEHLIKSLQLIAEKL